MPPRRQEILRFGGIWVGPNQHGPQRTQVGARAGAGSARRCDDLLSRWQAWASANVQTALSYPTTAAGAWRYRCSRQYDDENGAIDQDVENAIMSAVDRCIERVAQPWRSVLAMHAKNLCTGVACWRSARVEAADLARAVAEARRMAMARPRAGGLM